ncbi:BCCT family transporter [Clostridium sp.]|uniref:BCCT family transporter n=1 Tax=Clostridium sp. TaxID=1506 RepID=UPI003F333759
MKRFNIKFVDIFISLSIIVILSILILLFPDKTTLVINNIKQHTMNILSPLYLWIGLSLVILSIFSCISKIGKIKLGNEKPEYSTMSWLIMIFCTGMGSNLLYWSAIEWIYYYSSPPLGIEPMSFKAAEISAVYGGFHWSITGWSIYAIGAITLGIRYYNKKIYSLSLTDCTEKVLGRKYTSGIFNRVIELIFLFGTIGGTITMISFVVPMYCNNLSYLLGIPNNFKFQFFIIVILSVIFTISTCKGLKNGVRKVSQMNIVVALILVFTIFILGPKMFIIKSTTNSIGYMLNNFVQMSLWTDPIKNSGFVENWTAFYWIWWIGLAPSMWIFIAKISRGRMVREILCGVIVSGSIGCWIYFGVISNYGIYNQINNKINLVEILTQNGPEQAVLQMILSLPYGNIILWIWTIVGITFIITTMDSQAYTLAVSTTTHLNENEQPSMLLRIFWCMLLIMLPVVLMRCGAKMETLQSYAIITGIPIAFLTIITSIGAFKYLKESNGKYVDDGERIENIETEYMGENYAKI